MTEKEQKIRFACRSQSMDVFAYVDKVRIQSADGERTYLIQVGVPREDVVPSSKSGYPVLFMLDGNEVFHESVRFHPKELPAAIMVGIGYDEDVCNVVESRSLDYTPPIAGVENLRDPRVTSRRAGGADLFLDMLREMLLPWVIRSYPVDPMQKIFYGHSYGGLCVLHALFTRPSLFDHWVATSPSIWWHDYFIYSEADHFLQTKTLEKTVMLLMMVGEKELLRQKREDATGTLTAVKVEMLAKKLMKKPFLEVLFTKFSQANHTGAFQNSIATLCSQLKLNRADK